MSHPTVSHGPNPRQRLAAVCLIIIQSLALGILMKATVVAICGIALALAGWRPSKRQTFSPQQPAIWYGLIVAIFAIKHSFAPKEFPFEIVFVSTALAFEIACCCLVLQLFCLFLKRYRNRLPVLFAALSGTGLAFTCDVRVDAFGRNIVFVLICCYLVAWGLFASASRERTTVPASWKLSYRTILLGVVFLAASLLTIGSSQYLKAYESRLENMLVRYLNFSDPRVGRVGFSGLGGLSDVSRWKRANGETVSLQIESDQAPGYLRGRAFDFFHDNRWITTTPQIEILPSLEAQKFWSPRKEDNVFLAGEVPEPPLRNLIIWPDDVETAGHCFLPLNTAVVACSSPMLQIDNAAIIQRPIGELALSYVGMISDNPTYSPPTDEDIELYTQLPYKIDPRVRTLASSVCPDGLTPTEKMQKIEEFFHANFQYEWGIEIPYDEDRLSYFLIERPPAHCEYFATAGVILLRLAGVPARYVTGFVVTEQNPIDKNWVARRKDSHAWVEAYDSVSGQWITVEPTPERGIPTATQPQFSQQLWESVKIRWLKIQEAFITGAVWETLLWIVQATFVISIGAILLLVLRKAFEKLTGLQLRKIRKPAMASRLIQERMIMDRLLEKQGIVRPATETLLDFAGRLESAPLEKSEQVANWYRKYVLLRFRDQTVEETTYESFISERQNLVDSIRIKR